MYLSFSFSSCSCSLAISMSLAACCSCASRSAAFSSSIPSASFSVPPSPTVSPGGSSGFPRSTAIGFTVKKIPSASCKLMFTPVSASCNTACVFLGSWPMSPNFPSISVRNSSPEDVAGISSPLANCFSKTPVNLLELSGKGRPDPSPAPIS